MQNIRLLLIILLLLIISINSYRLSSFKTSILYQKCNANLFSININVDNKIENLDNINIDNNISSSESNKNNNKNRNNVFNINNIIKKMNKVIVSTALMVSSLNVPLLKQRRNIISGTR